MIRQDWELWIRYLSKNNSDLLAVFFLRQPPQLVKKGWLSPPHSCSVLHTVKNWELKAEELLLSSSFCNLDRRALAKTLGNAQFHARQKAELDQQHLPLDPFAWYAVYYVTFSCFLFSAPISSTRSAMASPLDSNSVAENGTPPAAAQARHLRCDQYNMVQIRKLPVLWRNSPRYWRTIAPIISRWAILGKYFRIQVHHYLIFRHQATS